MKVNNRKTLGGAAGQLHFNESIRNGLNLIKVIRLDGRCGMAEATRPGPIVKYFGDLEDPRIERAKGHDLLDTIAITLCVVVCGADNWVEIEEFGKAKRDWFAGFLKLPNGIPSHDTFRACFRPLGAGAVR